MCNSGNSKNQIYLTFIRFWLLYSLNQKKCVQYIVCFTSGNRSYIRKYIPDQNHHINNLIIKNIFGDKQEK